MSTATDTEITTELAEFIDREITPPCEVQRAARGKAPCTQPAELAVRKMCCGSISLQCEPCYEYIKSEAAAPTHICRACHELILNYVVVTKL